MKIYKHGRLYRASIQRDGKVYYVKALTRQDCLNQVEKLLLSLDKPKYTFKELFLYYITHCDLRGKKYLTEQYKYFDTYWKDLKDKSAYEVTAEDIQTWKLNRVKKVKGSTVNRQMSTFSAMYTYAQKEMLLEINNPFKQVIYPKSPKPRRVNISDNQINKVLTGLGYDGSNHFTSKDYVAWATLFALETAMRKGEILAMTWENVHTHYVHLPSSKNGESRDVPLSKKAKQLLEKLPKVTNKVVYCTEDAFRVAWQRNLKNVGLNGVITFHDLRHEAITRMVNQKKIPVEQLAKITGHKSIKLLIHTYYNPSPEYLASLLD